MQLGSVGGADGLKGVWPKVIAEVMQCSAVGVVLGLIALGIVGYMQ